MKRRILEVKKVYNRTTRGQKHGVHIEVWRFRDKTLPELTEKVSTSNYDDEVLRTLLLLRQQQLQTRRPR